MNISINNLERNRELVDLLNIASAAYYNTGKPIMSDKHFDEAFRELQALEKETGLILANSPTQNVGSSILSDLKEVKHNHKMLSLDKCHSVEEIIKFAKSKSIIGMLKLDGMSVSIKYEDGKLVSAETRGNGEIGVDITEHIKQFLNVPIRINKTGTYIIDGEAIITDDNFKDVNSNNEYANSRNLVSGTLNSLDTDVVKNRKVSFVAWDIIEGDDSINLSDKLLNAELLGFDITKNIGIISINNDSIQKVIDSLQEYANTKGIPIDGIVFKFDNVEYGKSLGATSHHFRNGIAYKFLDNGVVTEITNIEWSIGKTGCLTPVAVFKPVEIEGSIVERASVHNLSVLSDLDLIVGDKIEVIKANQIIPQIRKNISAIGRESQYIQYPAVCPCCGNKTKIECSDSGVENIICDNPNCKGKSLSILKHFVSKNAMNIDGLSEKKLDVLIQKGFITNYIDIYELKNNYFDEVKKIEGFGVKSANKLFDAIDESKNTTLDRFVYALSIPMIGRSAAKTISDYFNGDFNDFYKALATQEIDKNNKEVFSVSIFDWTSLKDFGNAMADSIVDYCTVDNLKMVYELSKYMNFEKSNVVENTNNSLKDKTFVITGKVNHYKNRDELKNVIESFGGKVVNSVSKNTTYLINNDINSNSSKNKKAKELNVEIITEEMFNNMIGN